MPAKTPSDPEPPPKTGPVHTTSATKVNVAFPFSRIRVETPSEEVTALADVVAELADLVSRVAPGPEADAVVERARSVREQLG